MRRAYRERDGFRHVGRIDDGRAARHSMRPSSGVGSSASTFAKSRFAPPVGVCPRPDAEQPTVAGYPGSRSRPGAVALPLATAVEEEEKASWPTKQPWRPSHGVTGLVDNSLRAVDNSPPAVDNAGRQIFFLRTGCEAVTAARSRAGQRCRLLHMPFPTVAHSHSGVSSRPVHRRVRTTAWRPGNWAARLS